MLLCIIILCRDDVTKWKPFPHYWPLVMRIHRTSVVSLHKGPVMQSSGVSYDVNPNKLLSKQSSDRWIETSWRSCHFTDIFSRTVSNILDMDVYRLTLAILYLLCYLPSARLTPPYMILLGINTALSRYFAEGPFWPETDGLDPTCVDSWWANLLYINNLVPNHEYVSMHWVYLMNM